MNDALADAEDGGSFSRDGLLALATRYFTPFTMSGQSCRLYLRIRVDRRLIKCREQMMAGDRML